MKAEEEFFIILNWKVITEEFESAILNGNERKSVFNRIGSEAYVCLIKFTRECFADDNYQTVFVCRWTREIHILWEHGFIEVAGEENPDVQAYLKDLEIWEKLRSDEE